MTELFFLKIPLNFDLSNSPLLQYLPVEERKVCTNASRQASLFGRILLYWLADQRIEGFVPPMFSYHDKGKPYFKEYPDFHFNISHSFEYVGVAVGNQELGVDIERHRKYKKPLAERFLHPDEFAFLESLPDEDQPLQFTNIWNLKESYVKYTGEGIANTFQQFAVIPTFEIIQKTFGEKPVFFKLYKTILGYSVSLCSPNNLLPDTMQEVSGCLFD